MKVRITFPDGTEKEYDIVVRKGMTLDDIVEAIIWEMWLEWSRSMIASGRKISREKYFEGVKKWLYPKLLEIIVEEYGRGRR